MVSLILASSSASRKALLQTLLIPFEAVSPNIDESPLPNEKPQDLALRLAIEKSKAIPGDLVIGSDQVIMCGDIRLDKPGNFENAVKQLQLVSDNYIDSYTGLCLINNKTNHIQYTVDYFRVYFRKLSQEVIENYIRKDNPLQCAGSIKAEGLGMTLFTKMQGNDPTALLGLPLISLTTFLLNENIRP